jgi:hypothetical protein
MNRRDFVKLAGGTLAVGLVSNGAVGGPVMVPAAGSDTYYQIRPDGTRMVEYLEAGGARLSFWPPNGRPRVFLKPQVFDNPVEIFGSFQLSL